MLEDVIACGIPRSGSTLVWQVLLRAVPARAVIKTHPASWDPQNGCFVVASIRHPYDIIASCFRTYVVTDPGNGDQKTARGTRTGLLYVLRMIQSNFVALNQLVERFGSKLVILRYEEFWSNFDVIFDVVEGQLDTPVPLGLRQLIHRECSFQTNRSRSFQDIWDTPEYCRTRIGPAHTAVGVPGSWKAIIPFWGYELMHEWCDPLCEEWSYAD